MELIIFENDQQNETPYPQHASYFYRYKIMEKYMKYAPLKKPYVHVQGKIFTQTFLLAPKLRLKNVPLSNIKIIHSILSISLSLSL